MPQFLGVLSGGFMKTFIEFLKQERGQDLVEYSLLLAFVSLVGAAAYLGMSSGSNTVWSVVNSRLSAANTGGS
jgi:Flp pilus assembly pilin Flp